MAISTSTTAEQHRCKAKAAFKDAILDGPFIWRPRQAPEFDTQGKGVQFFAKDSDGQWHYVNHAGTWQACPPPVS